MAETHGPSRVRRFGVFEFDPATGELRRQGMKIRLQNQPIEILALLLDHAGEIVTREELQKKLWPADTFVDFEHSFRKVIAATAKPGAWIALKSSAAGLLFGRNPGGAATNVPTTR